MTTMKRRIEYVRLADVKPAKRNPKLHADDELDASLDRFGYTEPLLMDERTGRLVAGHGRLGRLRAKEKAGDTPPEGIVAGRDGWKIPVVRGWSSANDSEAEAYLIASNRLVEAGGWDAGALAAMLEPLAQIDDGLVGVGYTPDDLTALLDSLTVEPEPEPDPEPDEPDDRPIITKAGDVWLLGPHRVMCGDCRNPDDVARLLDGAIVNVAVTSPPYADRRKYDETTEFRPIPPDEYVEWFAPVAENVAAHLADDGSWIVNIRAGGEGLDRDLYVMDLVIAHVRRWEWHLGDEFCWERNGIPKSPGMRFKNQWEPVYQFARDRWKFRPDNVMHPTDHMVIPIGEGAGEDMFARNRRRALYGSPEHWQGQKPASRPVAESTVGFAYLGNRLPTFTGSHEATGHTAAFPVGLPAFFVKAYSDEGDVVFDPFLGSGSTLLAAHQNGRVGLGMELSPRYVDTTLRRFQRHTGIVPRREDGTEVDFLA